MEGETLRARSAGSLQEQVLNSLLQRIGSEFGHGALLPGEVALCQQYGVSRITIRAALARLVEKGLLIRKQGVGTFVAGRETTPRSFSLLGFLDEIRAHEYRVMISEVTQAPGDVARALAIEAGSAVQHLRCVIQRDDDALTVSDSWTATGSGRELTESDLRSGIPSVQAMAYRVGARIERAEQVLEPVALAPEYAPLLELVPGSPVLRARRTYFETGDRPVQFAVIHYHPTHFRFDVDLVMRGQPQDPIAR
ncbi:MAG: GntR family transcriptional regulator [Rhodobacteraceae bacterium]|nr:GntR family transcriptional regulator [Paracoccaceae bacterium]